MGRRKAVKGKYGGSFGGYLDVGEILPPSQAFKINALSLYLIGDRNNKKHKYTMEAVAERIAESGLKGAVTNVTRAYYFWSVGGANQLAYCEGCKFEKATGHKVIYDDIKEFVEKYPNGTADKEISFEDFLLQIVEDEKSGKRAVRTETPIDFDKKVDDINYAEYRNIDYKIYEDSKNSLVDWADGLFVFGIIGSLVISLIIAFSRFNNEGFFKKLLAIPLAILIWIGFIIVIKLISVLIKKIIRSNVLQLNDFGTYLYYSKKNLPPIFFLLSMIDPSYCIYDPDPDSIGTMLVFYIVKVVVQIIIAYNTDVFNLIMVDIVVYVIRLLWNGIRYIIFLRNQRK